MSTKNPLTKIGILLEYGIILWMITPFLTRNLSHSLIIVLVTLWAIIFAVSGSARKVVVTKSSAFLFLWLAYIIGYRVLGISTASWGNYFHIFGFWLCYLIYRFNIRYASISSQKRLIGFIWIATVINILNSCYLISIHPSIIDSLYRSYGAHYLSTNIGEAHYALYAVFFFLFNFIQFRFRANNRMNLFYIFGMLVSLLCLYFYQKASPFIVFIIILLAWQIYRPFSHKENNQLSKYLIATVFFVLAIILFPSIVRLLDGLLGDNPIVSRLKDICNLFYGSTFLDSSGSGTERFAYNLVSIKTWLSSLRTFLFGVGYESAVATGDVLTMVGQHSELLDTLARYGIIGTVLFLCAIINIFKEVVSSYSQTEALKYIYVGSFIYCIINVLTSNPYLGVSLLILITFPFQKKRYQEENY